MIIPFVSAQPGAGFKLSRAKRSGALDCGGGRSPGRSEAETKRMVERSPAFPFSRQTRRRGVGPQEAEAAAARALSVGSSRHGRAGRGLSGSPVKVHARRSLSTLKIRAWAGDGLCRPAKKKNPDRRGPAGAFLSVQIPPWWRCYNPGRGSLHIME